MTVADEIDAQNAMSLDDNMELIARRYFLGHGDSQYPHAAKCFAAVASQGHRRGR